MMDTKSSDNKTTLLHYLIRILVEKQKTDMLKGTIESFKGCVSEACRVNLVILEGEISNLGKIQRSLKSSTLEYPSHLAANIAQAGITINEVSVSFKAATQAYQDILVKFGEIQTTPTTAKLMLSQLPDCPDFFNIFRVFAGNLERCLGEVQKMIESEKRQLSAQQQGSDSQSAAAALPMGDHPSASKKGTMTVHVDLSESGGDQKGVMDSLLDSLRTKANGSSADKANRPGRRRTAKLKGRRHVDNGDCLDQDLQTALEGINIE
jgi:hypothetical protein